MNIKSDTGNPHWLSAIISRIYIYIYGDNLEIRLLEKFLSVVGNSDNIL